MLAAVAAASLQSKFCASVPVLCSCVLLCRCALQESSTLQGQLQELSHQVQDLTQQLLEAQNAKVGRGAGGRGT